VELAVLLATTNHRRSITLAGDTNQSIVPEHGFSNWTQMLADLASATTEWRPLRVSYRSTRPIVDCALHVLGPWPAISLRDTTPEERPCRPSDSCPPESATIFVARALRDLVQHEPLASVALIARHPEQARLYFEALARQKCRDCVWWLTRIFCSGRDRCHRLVADQRTGIRHRDPVGGDRRLISELRHRTPHAPRRMTRAAHNSGLPHRAERASARGLALSLQRQPWKKRLSAHTSRARRLGSEYPCRGAAPLRPAQPSGPRHPPQSAQIAWECGTGSAAWSAREVGVSQRTHSQ